MRVYGFTIAGINRKGYAGQAMFAFSSSERAIPLLEDDIEYDSSGDITYSVIPCLLTNVGAIATSFDPYRVREKFSTYRFSLSATDEVGSTFFRLQDQAISEVGAEIAAADTTLDLGTSGLDTAPFDIEGDTNYVVYYLGKETIYVPEGGHTTGGVYEGCVRAAAGSKAQRHKEGNFIYDDVPFWIGRQATLFSWTPDDGQVIRDIGVISNSVGMKNARINIEMNSYLSGLDRMSVNQNPISFPHQANNIRDSIRVASSGGLTGYSLVGQMDVIETDSDISFNMYKTHEPDGSPLIGSLERGVFLQVDKDYCVYMGDGQFDSDTGYFLRNDGGLDGLFGSDFVYEEDLDKQFQEFHALFGIKRDTEDPKTFHGPTEAYEYLTINTGLVEVYKYHPLAICAGFLMSTQSERINADRFDVFHHNWSLDKADAFSDASIQEVHDLIKATPWAQVDQLILGASSNSIKMVSVIREILHTYGFKLSVDNEGYLKFSKIGLMGVGEFSEAITNPITALASGLLSFEDGSADRTTVLSGTYGKTPWRKGRSFQVSSLPSQALPPEAQGAFDEMSVMADTINSISDLRAQMESRALIQDFQSPRLSLRFPDRTVGDHDYSLGSYLSLNDLPLEVSWLFNKKGERLKSLENEIIGSWVGQIIGRRYMPKQNVYEIELFFANEGFIRWRAPSAVVTEGGDTAPTGTIQISTNSSFGDEASDALRFSVGDQVLVYAPDFATERLGSARTITEVHDTYVVITPNSTSAIEEGDILELSYINTTGDAFGYINPNILAGIDRVYTFMGDLADTLGSNGDPADQYGG